MAADAARAAELAGELFERARSRLRPGLVVDDLNLVLEGCAAVRMPTPERTAQMRLRYVELLTTGLVTDPGPLPARHPGRARPAGAGTPAAEPPPGGSGGSRGFCGLCRGVVRDHTTTSRAWTTRRPPMPAARFTAIAAGTAVAAVLVLAPQASAQPGPAPGGPGAPASWTDADKHGFGTSRTPQSEVWFTLRPGELSEVYYPDLGTPALRDLDFVVTDGTTAEH